MEILEPLELSVTRASEILGVTRPALSALLNGRASLSPDMALLAPR
jgi:plasmid maintenance system antidote protein VapI